MNLSQAYKLKTNVIILPIVNERQWDGFISEKCLNILFIFIFKFIPVFKMGQSHCRN